MSERVNVTHQAREFKAHGLPRGMRSPIPTGIKPDSNEAYAFRISVKPELYALTSVVTEHIVNKAYENRKPPSQRLTILDRKNSFVNLGASIRQDIYLVVNNETFAFEAGNGPDYVVQAYKRMDLLTWGINDALPGTINQGGKMFLIAGINTVKDIMAGVLSVIPEVHGINRQTELLEIAENTYPLILKIATSHMYVGIDATNQLRTGSMFSSFDKKFFQVRNIGGKKYLSFSEEAEEVIKRYEYELSLSSVSPTVGCPAAVNLGQGNSIRKMWDWHLEYARVLYPKLVPAPKK